MTFATIPGSALASGFGAAAAHLVPGQAPGPGLHSAVSAPNMTVAALMAKKKKKKKRKRSSSGTLTPEKAEPKRDAIRAAVAEDVAAERWGAAADETEDNAALLGDPISFKEAAGFRYKQAEADRDISAAKAAIETATVALDLMHFYQSVGAGEAVSEWQPIAPSQAGSLIVETEQLIADCESLIEEIEAEQEAAGVAVASDDDGKKKKKRQRKPGTVMIALGSVFTAVGAGGLSMVAAGTVISSQKQTEVEGLTLPQDQPQVDQLDKEGSQANLIAFIGGGVALAGLAVGVPLIAVGVRKRKRGGDVPANARLRVVPTMTKRFGGVSLHGRF